MNIVFISYFFGGDSPVGVGALRIANAMAEKGCFVYVITSTPYQSSNPRIIVDIVSNTPKMPSNLSFTVSNLLKKELNYISWELKAKRLLRRIIHGHKIDGIYTRSTPICVCPVGIYVKKHYQLPLIMHFTDPIPAPIGWAPNPKYRKRMIKQMKEYVQMADCLSFGNSRMINYQERILNMPLQERSFVSPDPAAGSFVWLDSNKKNQDKVTLLFLGNIYGNRNPSLLFKALSSITTSSFRFIIYGNSFPGAPSYVEFRPRTNTIYRALQEADVLVDIDGDDEIPVFVSSKLKDYLSVNRPILSITPDNSPSRDLLMRLKTVELSSNSSDSVKESLLRIINANYTEKDYEERIPIVQSFSAQSIAQEIINQIKNVIE